MRTRFDELRDSVKEKLKEVDKELLEMLNPDTWGHDDVRSSYIDVLGEVMLQIKNIRKRV